MLYQRRDQVPDRGCRPQHIHFSTRYTEGDVKKLIMCEPIYKLHDID